MRRVFGTALGINYEFVVPKAAETVDVSNQNLVPVIVDGKGQILNQYFFPSVEHNTGVPAAIREIPLPNNFKSYEEYLNAVWIWNVNTKLTSDNYLLPIPMGFSFKRPGKPYILTELEKSPSSIEHRRVKNAFSTNNTPLGPRNYLEMLEAVIDNKESDSKTFSVKGLNDQSIPKANHYTKETLWNGQLLPRQPMPEFFGNYESYVIAYRQWCNKVGTENIIPFHPSQYVSMLSLTQQDPSTKYFHVKDLPHRRVEECKFDLLKYKDVENFSEDKLESVKELLAGMKHVYNDLICHQEHHNFETLPRRKPFVSQLCEKFIDSYSSYGPTQPRYSKMLLNLLSNEYRKIIHFDINATHEIRRAIAFYGEGTCLENHYIIFTAFRKLFVDITGNFFDFVMGDMNLLHRIYITFAEFAGGLADIPKIHQFSKIKSDHKKGMLSIVQNMFYSLFICGQLLVIFSDPYIGHQKAVVRFQNHQRMFFDTACSLMERNGKEIAEMFEEANEETAELYLDLLYLILSAKLTKSVKTFVNSFKRTIFVWLQKLAIACPKEFFIFKNRVFRDSAASYSLLAMIAHVSLSAPRARFIKYANDMYYNLLISVIDTYVPQTSNVNNVKWVLAFISSITNYCQTVQSPLYYQLIYSLCCFLDRKFTSQTDNMLVIQVVSTIFSVLISTEDEYGQIVLLKCFPKVAWHESALTLLVKSNDLVGTNFIRFMISENIIIKIEAIRAFMKLILYHPAFLKQVLNLEKYNEIFIVCSDRSIEILIPIFKMLMHYYTHDKGRDTLIKEFLIKIKFKVRPILDRAKATVDNRHRAIVISFQKCYENNSALSAALNDVELKLNNLSKKNQSIANLYKIRKKSVTVS